MPKRKSSERLLNSESSEESVKELPSKRTKNLTSKAYCDDEDYEGQVIQRSSASDNGSDEDSSSDAEDGDISLDGELSRSGSTNNDTEDQAIQVTFDFCDPDEKYFGCISSLIQNYLPPKTQFDPSELADLIIEQGDVGTIIVQNGGEHVFAFITVLSLKYYKDKPIIKEIIRFLLAQAGSHKLLLEKALSEEKNTGLLIHEQMLNLPLALVPNLHKSLLDDIDWAIENETCHDERDKFKFDNYLLIAPCEVTRGGDAQSTNDLIFLKFDDEVFFNESEFSFDYSIPSAASKKGSHLKHVVALLKPEKYKSSVDQIKMMAAT